MKKKARHGHNTDDEFPVLAKLGLYAGNITGDGNCLFRSLSDQLYGDQGQYASVRAEVMQHILGDQERFEPFTGIYDETFETYTRRMAEDGTYGGHLEIVAFSEVHRAQVIIYQGDIQYAVNPQNSTPVTKIHVAYHVWEHYSSVRNKAGPHSGLPEVDPSPCEVEPSISSDEIPQWQVDLVLQSIPECSEEKARRLLLKKSYDDVIEDLLMGEEEPEPQEKEKAKQKDPRQERRDRRAEKRREGLAKRAQAHAETETKMATETETATETATEPPETGPEPTDQSTTDSTISTPSTTATDSPPSTSTKQSRASRKAAKKTKDFERKWAKKKQKAGEQAAKPSEHEAPSGPIFI